MPSFIYSQKFKDVSSTSLRISLGLVFLLFGALKVLGQSPILDLVNSSFPLFATAKGFFALGLIEMILGLSLLINKFVSVSSIIMVLHLLGTFLVFITGPELMFEPGSLALTMAGEFVVKNLVLITAGLVVLAHSQESKS